MLKTYGKSLVAFLYAVAVVAVPLFTGDHHIDAAEGIAIAIAAATAALTYLVPLAPTAPWTKIAVGAVLAGLQVAAGLIVGGIDGNGWVSILAAVIAALGITVAPAVSAKTGTAHGLGTKYT
jgi:hypothetical protein